jgi:hypothetical protein
MGTKASRLWLGLVMIAAGLAMQALAQGGDKVLSVAEATKMLPQSVYFKGQSATTQLRNSGGVKFADGAYLLAMMVDTSGYSSDVQQKYQAYFITEDAVRIEGRMLPAGIYGVGFVGDKFVVLDVGAHDLLQVGSHNDAGLKRPRPLEVVKAEDGSLRLYEGRKYIAFAR